MLFDFARPTFAAFKAPFVSGLVDTGDFIFFVASRPEPFAEKSLLEGRSFKDDLCLLFSTQWPRRCEIVVECVQAG